MNKYHEHALKCGIDMSGKEAVPVAQCAGRWPADDVLHPEDLSVYWPAGFYIRKGDEHWFSDIGCDYVICEAKE